MRGTNQPESVQPPGLYVVSVRDAVNRELAEHTGATYDSPPQTREQALTLIALLLGGAPPTNGAGHWACAIAGGRRTITLAPASDAPPPPHAPRHRP